MLISSLWTFIIVHVMKESNPLTYMYRFYSFNINFAELSNLMPYINILYLYNISGCLWTIEFIFEHLPYMICSVNGISTMPPLIGLSLDLS